jgi:DNA repair protein RadC
MAITDWPLDDRPREKLLHRGAESLSDAELVAIFLRTGVRGKSAVDVAREALTRFGSLSGLFAAGADAVTAVSGLGAAKYVQLQAVLEMARRALREQLDRGSALGSPQAVRDYLRLKLQDRPHEVFVGVFLDAQNRVLAVEELFRGTLTQTSVYPREVVKRALPTTPQPSSLRTIILGHRRAQPLRRGVDGRAQAGARAGRCQGARPLRHRRGDGNVIRRAWSVVGELT